MEWKCALIFEKKQDVEDAAEILRKNSPANPESQTKIEPDMLICSDPKCGKSIPQVVADYSQKWYGKHLCRDCQVEHQKLEGGES